MHLQRRKIFTWLKIVLIVYGVAGIAVYYLQDVFLFHPKKFPPGHRFNFPMPYEEAIIPMNGTDTVSLVKFFPAQKRHRGIVIYFHGNMENIEHYAPFAAAFTRHGYEVWMPDYPGYGKSTGTLTEDKMYDAAARVYKLAMQQYHSDSIIIYGKSLGTGVAAYIASRSPSQMLILETPYTNIPDLFASHLFIYPTGRMIHYKFPVDEYLGDVRVPVVIFHGTGDWIIPYRCAVQLKAQLKPADRFTTIEGADHHNINQTRQYFSVIDSLLK